MLLSGQDWPDSIQDLIDRRCVQPCTAAVFSACIAPVTGLRMAAIPNQFNRAIGIWMFDALANLLRLLQGELQPAH